MNGRRKVLFLNPVGTSVFDKPMYEYLEKHKDANTQIDVASLPGGPHHLEYYSYDSLVIPEILKKALDAERRGYDAFIIGCFYDPGLQEARELVDIVVTAPAESSFLIASSLGHRFSIIVGRRKWIPLMEHNIVKYGFKERFCSFKYVGLGVHDFHKDEKETTRRITQAAKEAINEGAEVIILGCTAFFGFYKILQEEIGPVIAALKYAEFFVDLRKVSGWSYSRVGGLEKPPLNEIKSWNLFAP